MRLLDLTEINRVGLGEPPVDAPVDASSGCAL